MTDAPLPDAPRHALPVFIAAFFAVWTLRATVLLPLDAAIGSPLGQWAYAAAWKLAAWLVPAVAYAAALRRPSVGQVLGLTPRPRALGPALVTTLLGAAAAVASAVVTGGAAPAALLAPPHVYLATLGAASVSVFCEEVLFRGLVLGELARRRPFWIANVLQAALFAAAHAPYWLWTRGAGTFLLTEGGWVFALGLFFGWLVRRTGSLWPAVAAHMVVNTLLGVLYAS